jgi:hypothetical protein
MIAHYLWDFEAAILPQLGGGLEDIRDLARVDSWQSSVISKLQSFYCKLPTANCQLSGWVLGFDMR